MDTEGLRIDRIDAEILRMLQEDSRTMYKDMAKKLHVSIPTVKARIDRLRELGVIRKFTAIVDPDRILGKIRVILLIAASPSQEVAAKLAEMPEVREVYHTTGQTNIVAMVHVDSLSDLAELTENKLPQTVNIASISSLVITRSLKEEYGGVVEPDAVIHIRCDFCKSPIVGKPVIDFIEGGKYYFSSEECAEAFRQKIIRA